MVFELLALAAFPVAIATAEGVKHQAKVDHDQEQQYRMKDFHLDVYCSSRSRKRQQVDRTMIVLKDGKLYLAPKDSKTKEPRPLAGESSALHPFTGFYLGFEPPKSKPDMFERLNRPDKIRGLVSTISENPPTLNWIYVDRNTLELKYGSRADAAGHFRGPFDWTDDEVGVTLEDWEGFVAVEEKKDTWALYYDRNDDGLNGLTARKRVLQCSLERRVIEEEIEEVIRR